MENKERLIENLKKIGEIGRTETGGITRLGFSPEYFKATEKLMELLAETKCCVTRDAVGNVHGILQGENPEFPEIIIGSHLDTVPEGGLYDGALGVACGLELFLRLKEKGIQLKHTLHLIAFNSEEAGILGGTFGSRVLLGMESIEENQKIEYLKNKGTPVSEMKKNLPNISKEAYFLELHIEQGGVLWEEKTQIGIVSGIFGIRRYSIQIEGESNHAGTTSMKVRKDPLVSASELISFIYWKAMEFDERLVATVGRIRVWPNLESVISGRVEIILEIRSLENELMDLLLKEVKNFAKTLFKTDIKINLKVEKPPLQLNEEMRKTIQSVCEKEKVTYSHLPSGAGHDAKSFAGLMPTGMIFIPSIAGKSHCKDEFSTEEEIETGMKIFGETVLLLDSKEETV